MWMLNNRTPYAAERSWVRGKRGEHNWIVAVKATFSIAPNGSLKAADEQLPPVLAPEYKGDPGRSSLLYESDLLGVKPPGTDVLVNGQAHAPNGRPAPMVPVSLTVGRTRKVLLVSGVRVYYGSADLKTTSPRPFTVQPIEYERAYGGMDTADADPKRHRLEKRNPIGRGFTTQPARLREKEAHTIDHASGDPIKLGPAGFGAIDRWWSPRLELAGSYDAAWEAKKKPLLPDDYDDRFELCAPRDQLVPAGLRGGEIFELVNMTPNGRLQFVLPTVSLAMTTTFGKRREKHPSRLATVIVEPDQARVMMVWQSSLKVPAHEVEHLDGTRIVEERAAA
jgi:hypothetical protein